MPLSLLQRYVLKELVPPFGVGILVFTFILILNHLFYMMDLFLNRGVEIKILLKMVLLVLPMFLPLSIPMASLLAALISYGRLSEDGELTALRSAGCAHVQYSWPNVLLGLILSLFLVHFNLNVAPGAASEFKKLHLLIAQKNPLALFAPKIMNHFGEYKVIVEKMDRSKKKLSGISIYKTNPVGAPTRVLAPEGELNELSEGDFSLVLLNGAVHQPNPDKNNEYTITKFNRFALRIPAQVPEEAKPLTPREMSFRDLRNEIKEAILKNRDPSPWKTELSLRVAIGFSPLIFILLGIVLGIRLKKGGKFVGVGMSAIVILLYYGLFLYMIPLASTGRYSPFLLTWLPNLATLSVAAWLWMRLARQ